MTIRPYRETDAPRCCEIILACLPQLDGLNDEARTFLVQKLVPASLHSELCTADAFVFEEKEHVLGLAALAGDEAKHELRGEASPSAAPFYDSLGFKVNGSEEFQRGPARFRVLTISKAL